ncbi:MAG: hypothetical protein HC922_03875 [Leptolyngbyaceae cyanobacterium SM2_3_12]|nr:hypothetical protein [Leptolyngbyaceae cyanobacterium SM2_3_12]
MAFFRFYIAPFFIVLIFAVAMLAVSARIFLPSDMMAPAPIEDPSYPTAPAPIFSTTTAPELSELSPWPRRLPGVRVFHHRRLSGRSTWGGDRP